jgi:hypothetical protein
VTRRQRGGALGTLVLLIAIAVAGYYAYKYFIEAEDAPSCKAQLNRCIAACRKNSTEAPQVEACQRKCEQDADACQPKR